MRPATFPSPAEVKPARAPSRAPRARPGVRTYGLEALLLPLVAVVAWQLLDTWNVVPRTLVPPPTAILRVLLAWIGSQAGGGQFFSGHFVGDAVASLARVALGFGIAAALGIGLGVAIGWWPPLERLVAPTLQVLGPIPPVTWVPLSIIWFGIGNRSAVFLVILGAFFPIVVTTVQSVRGVDRSLIRAGQMMGATTFQLVRWVALPAALPGILGGLRIGVGTAWIMGITAEMLAVHSGLGYTLWNAYDFLRYDLVLAAMAVIGVMGFVSDWLLRRLLARTLLWHRHMGLVAEWE